MPQAIEPARRCTPFAEWPELDRGLWQEAVDGQRGRRFTQRSAFAHLRPASVAKYAEGWERFLGWLEWRGELDASAPPAARVTLNRVERFIDDLVANGNSDFTVVGRLQELQCALKVLAPGADVRWITRPGGVPIRQRLEMRRKTFPIHHPKKLFDWGVRLMNEALFLGGASRRQVQLRDGLLIAILAARALRLRSVASLTLGDRFRQDGETWLISLAEQDMKTGRPIEYRLPVALTPWVERYLTCERVELLAGARNDALWVNWGGARLRERGLEKRIVWRSAKEFGPAGAFGPHRFRYGVATVGPMEDTASPGASAAMLGISAGVAADHYDRGKRVEAAKRYHAGITQERRRTAPLARRLFAQQGNSENNSDLTQRGR